MEEINKGPLFGHRVPAKDMHEIGLEDSFKEMGRPEEEAQLLDDRLLLPAEEVEHQEYEKRTQVFDIEDSVPENLRAEVFVGDDGGVRETVGGKSARVVVKDLLAKGEVDAEDRLADEGLQLGLEGLHRDLALEVHVELGDHLVLTVFDDDSGETHFFFKDFLNLV